jgi:AraC-like DNA-binding protein
VERGFRRSGLPYYSLENANNYVPSHRFYAFVADMAAREQMEDLGFQAGQYLGANCADPKMTEMLQASPTMYSGLRRACELTNRTISRCEIGLARSPNGRHVDFYHRPSCGVENVAGEQIAWFGVATLLGMIRVFAGPGWRPAKIGIMARGRPGDSVRAAFPDTRIRPSREYSYVRMPAAFLGLPGWGQWRSASAPRDGVYQPISNSLAGSLKQAVRTYIHGGLSASEAAEMVGTSSRSLQRRLKQEGTSFSKLLDEVRFEFAHQALKDPDVNIADIAYTLGYSHPTHFSRAFGRIAGMSPLRYRRMLLHGRTIH